MNLYMEDNHFLQQDILAGRYLIFKVISYENEFITSTNYWGNYKSYHALKPIKRILVFFGSGFWTICDHLTNYSSFTNLNVCKSFGLDVLKTFKTEQVNNTFVISMRDIRRNTVEYKEYVEQFIIQIIARLDTIAKNLEDKRRIQSNTFTLQTEKFTQVSRLEKRIRELEAQLATVTSEYENAMTLVADMSTKIEACVQNVRQIVSESDDNDMLKSKKRRLE
jgi:exonuclease VII small subunit